MAREQIDKATVRNKLEPRREPYWGAPVERGLFVGFRRLVHGGNWIARWRDQDGKQHYLAIGPASDALDYDEAKRRAKAWQRVCAAGVDARTDVRTVEDACKAYVTSQRNLKGDAAAEDAEKRFKRTVYGTPLGAKLLDRVRQRDVEAYRDGLSGSKSTANRTMNVFKAAMNHAVKHRYVTADRAIEWQQAQSFTVTTRRELFLDLDQRRQMLAQAKGPARDLIEAVMLTGARGGELKNARRSQFDERTNQMTFDGKTGKRTVPLSPAAVELFKRLAKDKLPTAYLFTREGGEPWRAFDWGYPVRVAAKGLPAGTCLYTLRHSFITEAITGGLSPLEVARLVGTSLTMIDKHYGHLAQESARARLAAVSFV